MPTRDAVPPACYAEYRSTGPGANPEARVPWSHQLTAAQAARYKPRVLPAGRDRWDPVAAAAKPPWLTPYRELDNLYRIPVQ